MIVLLVGAFLVLKLVGFFDNNQIKLTVGTDEKDGLDLGVTTEKIKKSAETVVDEKVRCLFNEECGEKKCIEGICSTMAELYEHGECLTKCNFDSATFLTSDGQELSLNRGQSTYTAAGAVAWKLLSGPDYCQDSEVVVPVELEKLNLGKVLGNEVITLKVGERSPVITHPAIKSIQFTLEVKSIAEECS